MSLIFLKKQQRDWRGCRTHRHNTPPPPPRPSHPADEAFLDLDSFLHDGHHRLPAGLVLKGVEQLAGEVAVQALVPADHLVAEGQPGHEAPLLQPEDRAETS